MNGVRNLSKLLQEMNPEQVEGKFVFCTVSDETISSWDQRPMMTFVEKEGTTVIVTKKFADDNGFSYQEIWGLVTLTVHSDISAVGLLAAVTDLLSKAGIPVNTVSAFYHDHLFVPHERAEQTISLLEDLASSVQSNGQADDTLVL